MIYEKILALCAEKDVKPTTVLRSLGISATNLQRWKNGSTVNSGILMKLAEYFEVPIVFFSDETIDDAEQQEKIKNVIGGYTPTITNNTKILADVIFVLIISSCPIVQIAPPIKNTIKYVSMLHPHILYILHFNLSALCVLQDFFNPNTPR